MDESINTKENAFGDLAETYDIEKKERIDLRTINFDTVEKEFIRKPSKYLTIVDFKAFLQEQVERMISRNVTRIDFALKLQEIIERYNSKDSDVDKFFAALKKFAEALRTEDLRAQSEGLTEHELEVFDLLYCAVPHFSTGMGSD